MTQSNNKNQGQIDRLWYTWSKTGINPVPGGNGGYCIYAASPALREPYSDRVMALEPYLHYALPATTDPYTLRPETTPINLALTQNRHERLLLCKFHLGDGGNSTQDIYFAYVLTGLPSTFMSVDAISYWRAHFWQERDPEEAPYLAALTTLPVHEYLSLSTTRHISHMQRSYQQLASHRFINLNKANQYLPWFFQAVFQLLPTIEALPVAGKSDSASRTKQRSARMNFVEEQRQQSASSNKNRIFIAAPSDWIAYFISAVTAILPRNLQKALTFNTYESNPLSPLHGFIVGTSLPASYNEQINSDTTQHIAIPEELQTLILPPECADKGKILNCYAGQASSLGKPLRLEAQVAQDIVERLFATPQDTDAQLMTDMQELNHLDEFFHTQNNNPELTMSSFLEAYEEKFLWRIQSANDVLQLFLDPRIALKHLYKLNVREEVIKYIQQDPDWFQQEIIPLMITSLEAILTLILATLPLDMANLTRALNQLLNLPKDTLTATLLAHDLKTSEHADKGTALLYITANYRKRAGKQLLQPQKPIRSRTSNAIQQMRAIQETEQRLIVCGSFLPEGAKDIQGFLQKEMSGLSSYFSENTLTLIANQAHELSNRFYMLGKLTVKYITDLFTLPATYSRKTIPDHTNTVLWKLMLPIISCDQEPELWKQRIRILLEKQSQIIQVISELIHQTWEARVRFLLVTSATLNQPEDDALINLLLALNANETGEIFNALLSWEELPSRWRHTLLIKEWNHHSANTLRQAIPDIDPETILTLFKTAEIKDRKTEQDFYKNLVQNKFSKTDELFMIMYRRSK